MLECVITAVSQDLDLEANATLTFLVIRLPNGVQLRVAVDEDAAAQVISLQVAARGAPRSVVEAPQRPAPPPTPPPQSETGDDSGEFVEAPREEDPPAPTGEGVVIFGGQDASPAAAKPAAAKQEAAEDDLPKDDEGSPTVVLKEEPPAPKKNTRSRSRVQQLANGKVVVPSITVPAGAGGYPNVPGAGVNTADLTGSRDQDEDGVGSV